MPTARAPPWGNSTGSPKPASPASHTPSANERRTCPAARSASLVLPTPPTPVKVNSRVVDSSRLISVNSRRRSTKLSISLGRLPDGSRLITQVTLPAAPPTGAAEKRAIHQGWAIRPHVVCHRKVILRLCRPSEHGWTLIIKHYLLRLGRLANASPDPLGATPGWQDLLHLGHDCQRGVPDREDRRPVGGQAARAGRRPIAR